MIINPIALATKGYIGNDLNITIVFKGDIDLSATEEEKIHPTGGTIDYRRREEEEIFTIINAFLFMVNK